VTTCKADTKGFTKKQEIKNQTNLQQARLHHDDALKCIESDASQIPNKTPHANSLATKQLPKAGIHSLFPILAKLVESLHNQSQTKTNKNNKQKYLFHFDERIIPLGEKKKKGEKNC
jgi:hypothetical protein